MVPSPRMYRSGLKKSCYTLKTERKKKITLALATRFLDLLYGGIVSMGSLGLLAAAQAVLPAFRHWCFLPATPARRGIVVIVQDPITVDAKQTQNKELLMSLFLLTMQQLLGQLINTHWSLQQSSICTNYLLF